MIDKPLIPRGPDGILKVILIGRLSKPKENEFETKESIDSSLASAEKYLKQYYNGPLTIRHLGEQVSGLLAERATILEAMELILSGEWDLVLTEDLGRVYRNPRHQYIFAQDCVDADIRLICVADGLDTANENWEIMLAAAALRHGMHIPDTRRKIRRKAEYSFYRGGMVQKVKFGYRKLTKDEARSGTYGPKDLCIAKIPECTKVFHEIHRQATSNQRGQTIVDWLNNECIPPGPYVKGGWKVAILKSVICDPLLHGWRTFRRVLYKRYYSSGKHKRIKNAIPEKAHVPELAHLTLEQQESMVAALGWSIDWNNCVPQSKSARLNIARTNSFWPGQAAICDQCKGTMFLMGDHLRCKNSLRGSNNPCWNHVEVSVELMRRKMLSWILGEFEKRPRIHDTLIDAALSALESHQSKTNSNASARQQEVKSLEMQRDRLSNAIADGGELKGLITKLQAVEQRLNELSAEAAREEEPVKFAKPYDRDKLVAEIDDILAFLMANSYEFADVLRLAFPSFVIRLVQALDSDQVRPRGILHLPVPASSGGDGEPVEAEIVFDLFVPPDRIGLISHVIAARNRVPRPTLRTIALELGTSYMTVKRAIAYASLMEAQGLTEPYREISARPDRAARWRRLAARD
jgi:site-specific DNA recombinase